MAMIRLGPFLGASLSLHPRLLPDNVGVLSLNHKPGKGDLRPWKVPLTVDSTIGAGRKTIYLLGREKPTDTKYFFAWTTIVHAVRSFLADDTTKRTYYTGSGAPKVTDNLIGIAGPPYPTSYRDLGIPKPTTKPILNQTLAGTGDDETRFYAYTFLSDWDEEGMPQVSDPVTCKPGARFDITNLADPPSGENRGINRIRVYRTVAGNSSSEFYFLRDIALATSTKDDARATGTDTMPSTLYAMPPDDLKCLTALWNGMMAGISGKSVRYCEPFRPHAWPAVNETLLSEDIPVALCAYQRNLVILTTGKPRLVYGASPEAMDDVPIEFIAACISVTSVVGFGHGVAWATSDGLAYVGTSGPPRLLTEGLMLIDDWQAIAPTTIVAAQYEGRYVAFYKVGGVWKGFMLDPLNPTGIYFFDTGFSAVYFDALEEVLYVVDGTDVKKWDAGLTNMTVTFKSKVYRQAAPLNMSVAEVIADTYPVTFKLYADGALKFTKTVANRRTFFLPSGYLADDYQVEVSGTGEIQGVVVAETMAEIAQT